MTTIDYPIGALHIGTYYRLTIAKRVTQMAITIIPEQFLHGMRDLLDAPPILVQSREDSFYLAPKLCQFSRKYNSAAIRVPLKVPSLVHGLYADTEIELRMPLDEMVDLFEKNFIVPIISTSGPYLEFIELKGGPKELGGAT